MASTVTRSDLVQSISNATGLRRSDAEAALQAALEGIQQGLQQTGKVTLVGFGTFQVKERAARMGVNPSKPDQKIHIPASKTVRFKPGSALKDAVN